MSCSRKLPLNSCRVQLEQDVKRLQQLLQEETNLRAVLENALEHAASALSDLSHLPIPNNAQELLSNISTLETTVLSLEEEMVSLHFQLIQERNERRLAEYRLKQLPLQPFLGYAHQTETGPLDDKIAQEESTVPQVRQQEEVAKLQKQVSVKGLCNYPNKLSEEIVRCMRKIFISLADSSVAYPKSSAQEKLPSSPSPTGRYSVSSYWSLSEPRTTSSWEQSPQVVSECSNELLASEGAFDPYRDREKLGWADIGNYGLATEVSWMSVGKKQLEYAAEALTEFRLQITN